MSQTVHVFAGRFDSQEEACLYTEEQWESASDEEYSAWEERNPTWALRADLDADYLSGVRARKPEVASLGGASFVTPGYGV